MSPAFLASEITDELQLKRFFTTEEPQEDKARGHFSHKQQKTFEFVSNSHRRRSGRLFKCFSVYRGGTEEMETVIY